MIALAREVHVAVPIQQYIVAVSEATRRQSDLYLGASPRASIMLLRAARAWPRPRAGTTWCRMT